LQGKIRDKDTAKTGNVDRPCCFRISTAANHITFESWGRLGRLSL